MLSFWEKITEYAPLCQVGVWVEEGEMAPPPDHVPCVRKAKWVHVWQTEQSEEERDYYCEKHALEHGLTNYQLIRDSPVELEVTSGDPPGTVQYLGLDLETGAELTLHEQQSQETLIPYGGSGAEEATMFEDEEEDE
jgi:hypothetical protein